MDLRTAIRAISPPARRASDSGSGTTLAFAEANSTKNAVGSPPLFVVTWIVFRPATKPLLKAKFVVEPNPAKSVVAIGALPLSEIEPSLSVPKIPG